MAKILIADDEKDITESLAMILTAFGHEVSTAFDGKKAVEMAKSQKPDIIFLDLCFPKPSLDGVEILKAIREFDKDVKVVLTSGLSSEDEKYKEAEAFGVNKYLSKPITATKLQQIISELTK